MSGIRRLLQHRLHQCGESLETAPQVGETGSNPYPRSGPKLDHRCKLSSTTRTSAASTPFSTVTNARPGNSMWIAPDEAATAGASGVIMRLGSAASVTGRSSVRACLAAHEAPLRYSYATGRPGWRSPRAHAPLAQSMRQTQASLLQCAASPRLCVEPASRNDSCLPQSSRSQGHRQPNPARCRYGEIRTLTEASIHQPVLPRMLREPAARLHQSLP